jgi:predicted nucleic acid-binding protein
MQWFRGKPGGDIFDLLLAEAEAKSTHLCMSRINLGEVYYLVAKDYSEAAATALIGQLNAMPIEMNSVLDEDIDSAAFLKGRYSISYADAFAAVLAAKKDAPVVTGDPDFLTLAAAGVIRLRWVGK